MAQGTTRSKGTVKRFDRTKGFGFISPDDGSKDIFVHHSSIKSDGFRFLAEGQVVEFSVFVGDDGRTYAVYVTGPGGANVSGGGGGGRSPMAQGSTRSKGTVKRFDQTKGFGFISPDDGSKDLFVHRSSIKSDGFRSLAEGQVVEFSVSVGDDGRTNAVSVTGPGGANVSGGGGGGRGGGGYEGGGRGGGGRGGGGYGGGRGDGFNGGGKGRKGRGGGVSEVVITEVVVREVVVTEVV